MPSLMQDNCLNDFHSAYCPDCAQSREDINEDILREISIFLSHLAEMGDTCVTENCGATFRMSESISRFMEANDL